MHSGLAHRRYYLAGAALIVIAEFTTSRAFAQATGATPAASNVGGGELEEVVVTAQRRSENIQTVPLAVTAFGSDELKAQNLDTLAGLAQNVPGLNVAYQTSFQRITIRGIGFDSFSPGTESAATLNVDGVVYPRSSSGLAGLYDLARVEVLRGPQGTLYGRNATAGAINLITNKPTDQFEGNVEVMLGNYGTINTEGAISGPVTTGVDGRLAFYTQDHGGYGVNLVTGTPIDNLNTQAVRGQLLFNPSSRLSILLEGDYFQESDQSGAFHVIGPAGELSPGVPMPVVGLSLPGAILPTNLRDTATNLDPQVRAQFYGGHIDINYKLTDSVSLRSISAARVTDIYDVHDVVPVGPTSLADARDREDSTDYTQEFQLIVDTQRNKLVTGLFYLHEELLGLNLASLNLALFGGPNAYVQGVDTGGALNTNAAALYVQDDFSILPDLRLTLGERYSWERKTVDAQAEFNFSTPYVPGQPITAPFITDAHTWTASTPKVGLEWDAVRGTMFYVSYSQGFKAGTYNLGAPILPPVSPEKVDAYDGGVKSTLFDGRFQADIDGFHYKYSNLQVFKEIGLNLVEENAAAAVIYGIDGEFQLKPFSDRNLLLQLKTEWLHARFTNYISADPTRPGQGDVIDPTTGELSFNLAGNSLEQAPDYTVNLAVQYTFPIGSIGTLTPRIESFWTGRVWFTQFNVPQATQPPTNKQDAYLSWKSSDHRFYANAYVKNIANKLILSSGSPSATLLGAAEIDYLEPPRTYGVTIGTRF